MKNAYLRFTNLRFPLPTLLSIPLLCDFFLTVFHANIKTRLRAETSTPNHPTTRHDAPTSASATNNASAPANWTQLHQLGNNSRHLVSEHQGNGNNYYFWNVRGICLPWGRHPNFSDEILLLTHHWTDKPTYRQEKAATLVVQTLVLAISALVRWLHHTCFLLLR